MYNSVPMRFPIGVRWDRGTSKLSPDLHSLKLTASKATENRPFCTKRKRSYSKHLFSGEKMLVSGRVNYKW